MVRSDKALHLLPVLVSLIMCTAWIGHPVPAKAQQLLAKETAQTQIGPKAVFPTTNYTFGEVFEGTDIKYDFVVENRGDAPLVIKNIRPD